MAAAWEHRAAASGAGRLLRRGEERRCEQRWDLTPSLNFQLSTLNVTSAPQRHADCRAEVTPWLFSTGAELR